MLILYLSLLYSMAYGDFLSQIKSTEKEERYGALQCVDARFVNDQCQGYLKDSETKKKKVSRKLSKQCKRNKCCKIAHNKCMTKKKCKKCCAHCKGPDDPFCEVVDCSHELGEKYCPQKCAGDPQFCEVVDCSLTNASNFCPNKCNGKISSTPMLKTSTIYPSNPTIPTITCPPIPIFTSPPVTTCPPVTPCPSVSTSPSVTNCPPVDPCPTCQAVSTCPEVSTCPPIIPTVSTTIRSSARPPTSEATTITNSGCSSAGQRVTVANTGANIITSPGYPQTNYTAGTFCDWTFQAPPGQKISFTLLELETEFGYDVLKLYDGAGGKEEKEQILATMSGTNIYDAVISSKEEMRVTFTTDISNNMKGFKASVSAFKKEVLPRFDWLDERNINVTFPNGKNEIISLNLSPNARRSCVFHGKTVNTSLTISTSNTNSGCRSLTEDVEISIISNNLEGKLGLFSLKNGKLQKVDETVFVSNSLNREINQLSKRSTEVTLPKKIQIPVNFGFDRGLLLKLGKYGLGQNFIERRIEEVFNHGKILLQGISNNIIIDLILIGDIVFIDDILHMNHQDLVKSRQFQVDEQNPLIILIDDEYANHVKGLSFRSGACRNDREPHGVTMVAWNEHSAFMGDVVYHEMGHMLGGIHDGGKSEHHSGLHLGHSEFNSQNVNDWFLSAGYRCYGKSCTGPPSSPSQGSWTCDFSLTSCQLICSPGYTPVISHTDCINGQWDTTNSHVCVQATSSDKLYLLAGGFGALRNVELYHPTLGSPSCKSPPPKLPENSAWRTSFIHDSTVYICIWTTCHSLSMAASSWTSHTLSSTVGMYLSSVVLGDRAMFIGGYDHDHGGDQYATYATLPLSSSTTLRRVPNLSYRGRDQCVAKLSSSSVIITGGQGHVSSETLSTVLKYDLKKESSTSMASLSPPRYRHSCISLQEEGKMWLIVTGGSNNGKMATTQRLDVQANTWENLGDMKQERYGHAMINTNSRGVLVLGGKSNVGTLKTVEVLVNKEWQTIEPSLAVGRYFFGGAVEVPRNLFSCQLNLHPGLGCPAPSINTLEREDETSIEEIATMEECSMECKKRIKCNFWTWFNQEDDKNSLICVLMSNYGSILSDSNAVTADAKCDLGCPTPTGRDKGNWTCNEAKTSCTLNCSPGYVSLHTEIKCSGGEWQDVAKITCLKKKQPVSVPGCSGNYLYDEEFPGGEVVTVPENLTCHSVCKERPDCVSWTWTKDKDCRLQTTLETNKTKNGSISGLQNACRPVCYLVVGKDDQATTNTHYCPDPNQQTSCQDIIQMERSKFKEGDEILVCYEATNISHCGEVLFEDVDKICSDLPAIVSNSIYNRLRKRRFTRSNYVTLG